MQVQQLDMKTCFAKEPVAGWGRVNEAGRQELKAEVVGWGLASGQ